MTSQYILIIKHYVALIKVSSIKNSLSSVEEMANSIAINLDLNVVKKISHMFKRQGITLIYILSQSQLVVHTWTELGIIHIDLVTCSYRSEEEFEKSVRYALNSYKIDLVQIKSVEFDRL